MINYFSLFIDIVSFVCNLYVFKFCFAVLCVLFLFALIRSLL